MALRHPHVFNLSPHQLKNILNDQSKKVRLIDCRSFLEYNDNHIIGAVNICCSKLIKRRLQQEKISLKDLLLHCRIEIDDTSDIVVVVYDQLSESVDDFSPDSFIYVLLKKLIMLLDKVYLLSGGFMNFNIMYPEICEDKIWKYPGLTTLSQPCLSISNTGPTKILPFLYLGSEEDANNREVLQNHNITYELNVSNKCPKPEFISDGHFMRIPVNDNHNEKLQPHFCQAFKFVDKVRESNACVLVHCLAGISRSPTIAIAYVMRYLKMTCEDAYRYVKAKRANISPNFNFLGQLLEYEKELISQKIVKKVSPDKPLNFSPSTSDYLLGSVTPPLSSPTLIPPTIKLQQEISQTRPTPPVQGKKLNLSLRFSPFSTSSSTSSSTSPTTAMARLNFDKPFGKENRTAASCSSSCSSSSIVANESSASNFGTFGGGTSASVSSGGMHTPSFSLGPFSLPNRPNRLVKEQNNVGVIQEEGSSEWESMTKSVTRQSLSISFSKGGGGGGNFKNRKSSADQILHQKISEEASTSYDSSNTSSLNEEYGNNKKCRVHKIVIEGDDSDVTETQQKEPDSNFPSRSSSNSNANSLILSTDSASSINSPLGGYNSKRDLMRSDSVSTSGIGSEISEHELLNSSSWEMSESGNLINVDDGVFSTDIYRHNKSPSRPSRQLQLWSSDSGHWSNDEGISCSSSTIEIPTASTSAKSPEKRKCTDSVLAPPRLNLTNLEKRRSFAGTTGECSSNDWNLDHLENINLPKRWSIAENAEDIEANIKSNADTSGNWMNEVRRSKTGSKDIFKKNSSNLNSEIGLNCLNWLSEADERKLCCCEQDCVRNSLYRAHSCPILQNKENNVPESPSSDPISSRESALLKMYKCRNHHNFGRRSLEQPLCLLNSISSSPYSLVDYDELWWKLKRIKEASTASKTDSKHGSSSTLSSSSFSILVK